MWSAGTPATARMSWTDELERDALSQLVCPWCNQRGNPCECELPDAQPDVVWED